MQTWVCPPAILGNCRTKASAWDVSHSLPEQQAVHPLQEVRDFEQRKKVKAGTRAVIAPIWSEPADHGEMPAELQISICLAKPFSNKSSLSKMELQYLSVEPYPCPGPSCTVFLHFARPLKIVPKNCGCHSNHEQKQSYLCQEAAS